MSGDAHHSLEAVLDREIEVASSLAVTLDAERTALTGTSPQAVIDAAAQKTELFALLERLETQRRELCGAGRIILPRIPRGGTLSASLSPAGPALAGISTAIADRWRALLELIAKCQVANDINGYIINARRGQVRELFQAIRGGGKTYGPRGNTLAHATRALAWA